MVTIRVRDLRCPVHGKIGNENLRCLLTGDHTNPDGHESTYHLGRRRDGRPFWWKFDDEGNQWQTGAGAVGNR